MLKNFVATIFVNDTTGVTMQMVAVGDFQFLPQMFNAATFFTDDNVCEEEYLQEQLLAYLNKVRADWDDADYLKRLDDCEIKFEADIGELYFLGSLVSVVAVSSSWQEETDCNFSYMFTVEVDPDDEHDIYNKNEIDMNFFFDVLNPPPNVD